MLVDFVMVVGCLLNLGFDAAGVVCDSFGVFGLGFGLVGCFGIVVYIGWFGLLVGFACTLLNLLAGCFSFGCYSCYCLGFGLVVFACLLWDVLRYVCALRCLLMLLVCLLWVDRLSLVFWWFGLLVLWFAGFSGCWIV